MVYPVPSSPSHINHDVFLVASLPYALIADFHGPSNPQNNSEAFMYEHASFVRDFFRDFPAFGAKEKYRLNVRVEEL